MPQHTSKVRTVSRRGFLRQSVMAGGLSAGGVPLLALAAASQPGPLRAGAATADITPPVGVSMKGPIGGNGIVRKIHDPLSARAIVLDDGATRLAICVCETTMIWARSIERAKRLAEAESGIPVDRILISATHAHSTPRMNGMGTAAIDKEYYDYFERQIAAAICNAAERTAPARAGWAQADVPEFIARRRFRIEPGSNGPNPFGETTDRAWMYAKAATRIEPLGRPDPQFSFLLLQHADGRPMAVLGSYSVHYTGGFNRDEVSADYPPHFSRRLAELFGVAEQRDGFVGMVANGNSGNLGGSQGQRGYDGMKRVGYRLAEVAYKACQTMDFHTHVPVAMREERLELGVRRPDPQRLAWAEAVQSGQWSEPAHNWRDVYVWNTFQLKDYPPTVAPKFQVIRIGEVGIASNPCEMYAETGLEIKEQSPLPVTLNIQLANDYNGYLPPPEQHALGGYTTWPAISSYLELEASEKIREHLLKMLAQV